MLKLVEDWTGSRRKLQSSPRGFLTKIALFGPFHGEEKWPMDPYGDIYFRGINKMIYIYILYNIACIHILCIYYMYIYISCTYYTSNLSIYILYIICINL